MSQFYAVSNNLTSFIFLSIVLYIASLRLDHKDKLNRLFLNSCLLTIVALLADVGLTLIPGNSGQPAFIAYQTLLYLLVLLPPVMAYNVMLLTEILSTDREKDFSYFAFPCLLPVLINFVLMSINYGLALYHGQLFIYSNGAGVFNFIMGALTFCYFIRSFYNLMKSRKMLGKEYFWMLFLFCLLPSLAGLAHLIFPSIHLLWPVVSGSLIILYLYLQDLLIQRDSLTGAFTRRSFYRALNKVYKKREDPLRYGIIFMDLDGFKSINDQYGHAVGDKALTNFTKLVRKTLREEDLLARFGGDEFIILSKIEGPEALTDICVRIEQTLSEFNQSSNQPYQLSCSMGSKVIDPKDNLEDLIAVVDQIMYAEKHLKAAASRSASPQPTQNPPSTRPTSVS
ncbi:MAG: GGDEF domain-containing protein [Oscillospiraceae bacterium]|nr:GGDEF domain-containing protein [Oscillospiraceae bacterium]MDD4369140.1 GGDEF domain-containing protein [Oscillospiraceae bacterium]